MRLPAALLAIGLSACARSAILPLSADTIQITTSAAPVCGATSAQNVALRRAAIETISRGFDKFVILAADAKNNVGIVGYTPVIGTTTGSATINSYGNIATFQGSATTTYSGGYPIVAGTHDQALVVKMFRDDDPLGSNAISARSTLGPNWEMTIKQSTRTTC